MAAAETCSASIHVKKEEGRRFSGSRARGGQLASSERLVAGDGQEEARLGLYTFVALLACFIFK